MPKRRDVLKLALAGGAISTLPDPLLASAALPIQNGIGTDRSVREFANLTRARALMREKNIDAIVTSQVLNSAYFTGYRPMFSKMGFEVSSIVVVPCDESRPITYVVPSVDLWRLSNRPNIHLENIIPVTGPLLRSQLDGITVPTARPARNVWPTHSNSLTERERVWLDANETYQDNSAASMSWGLVKALRDLSLTQSTLAIDDSSLKVALTQLGLHDLSYVDGATLMRRIRMVKTASEIEMMRVAADRNASAANATLQQLDVGMELDAIEGLFAIEAAKRGMESVFIVAGSLGGLPHERVVEGAPIMIDAVSHFGGYHGDYGRTFIVGEAPKSLNPKVRMLEIAREAVISMIKPGVKYSEISAAAKEAVRKSDIPFDLLAASPHSVGLQHTDEPSVEGFLDFVKDDIVLEENMTITVDMPNIEPGWGACHLEDMILVSADGPELLNSPTSPLIEV